MSISAIFLWQMSLDLGVNPPDEEKWTAIRLHRQQLLADSDWTQLADAPITAGEKNTWTAYRQILRDLPQDYTNPDEVQIPEAPQWQTTNAS
jgi:hypothetical protein